MRAGLTRVALAVVCAGAIAGCRTPEPSPQPPVSREALEVALIGTWDMITPSDEAGTFWGAERFIFQRNNVFVIPTYRDYGGRFQITDVNSIQLHHAPTNTTVNWRFEVDGDSLTFYDGNQPIHYRRVQPPGTAP